MTALVLTGGGARAAYQVGVLVALKEILAGQPGNPFPIICGTSAGAINAAAIASHCHHFATAVDQLRLVWEHFEAEQVYRADAVGVAMNSARWLGHFLFGAFVKRGGRPVSLFDNRPLAGLLHRRIDFSGIERAIADGHLEAVSITCSGYASGQSCSFFEGAPHHVSWKRAQRVGIRSKLTANHLLASSAIPFIFPPVKLNREYFGDGSMRQLAPVSPALHLGARRVLVVATAKIRLDPPPRTRSDSYPSLAEIGGHAMRSIFLDNLALDVELLERINQTVNLIEPDRLAAAGLAMRHVDVLVLTPSEPLDALAPQYLHNLPLPIRFMLRSIGAMRKGGAHLASYLLFEHQYCQRLIELGYQDTLRRRDEVAAFLEGSYCPMPGSFATTVRFMSPFVSPGPAAAPAPSETPR
jgi:NTE family protein